MEKYALQVLRGNFHHGITTRTTISIYAHIDHINSLVLIQISMKIVETVKVGLDIF